MAKSNVARAAAGRALQVLALNTGFDPLRLGSAVRGVPGFLREIRRYRAAAGDTPFPLALGTLVPALADRTTAAGTASGHYFHQDLWAARRVFEERPRGHLDIGSRIDGFVAHLLVFMPVTVVDVRALDSTVPGLTFAQDDATTLASIADQTQPSVSCLHAAEHFGLGRYGDPIAPEAPFKLMSSLARVLSPGGRLYFSVPVGVERLEFNAHRVFDPRTVLRGFGDLHLVAFSAVNDDGDLLHRVSPECARGWRYGCGLFEFTR